MPKSFIRFEPLARPVARPYEHGLRRRQICNCIVGKAAVGGEGIFGGLSRTSTSANASVGVRRVVGRWLFEETVGGRSVRSVIRMDVDI